MGNTPSRSTVSFKVPHTPLGCHVLSGIFPSFLNSSLLQDIKMNNKPGSFIDQLFLLQCLRIHRADIQTIRKIF